MRPGPGLDRLKVDIRSPEAASYVEVLTIGRLIAVIRLGSRYAQ